jgi:hypothetical protein
VGCYRGCATADALDRDALSFRELRRFYAAVPPGVRVLRGVELSANQHARAAWLWSGRHGVLAGLSASATLGAKWIEPDLPAQLVYTKVASAVPSLAVATR